MRNIIFILLVICLVSCADLTSGKRFENNYIVVGGMIYANEPITAQNPISLTRSISVDGGNINDFLITDAIVSIEKISSGESQDLVFSIDIASRRFGYYDPTESFIVEPGETYRFTAIVDGETIYAETIVPDIFEVIENEGYTADANGIFPEMVHREIDIKYPLSIKVNSDETIVLYLEYYCLEEWDQVEVALFDYLGMDFPGFDEPEEYESTMDGSPRKIGYTETMVPRSVDGEFVIQIPFTQVNFQFYGRNRLTIHKIDDNYFKYSYKSQGYYHGGIKGGIGYFGSASRQALYTKIIK